jgi:hypothetical protein
VDDLVDLNSWQKLTGQIVAAGLAGASGLLNASGASWRMIPLAMIWLLACCNGFNLIDGMDGLAAGAGIFAALAIAVSAMLAGNSDPAAAALPLAGALAGLRRRSSSRVVVPAPDCAGAAPGSISRASRKNPSNFFHKISSLAIKSGNIHADKRSMAYSSLPPRVTESKTEIRHAAGQQRPETVMRVEWFTGLAVSPVAFSRQLGDLQLAMQRAARSAKTR